MWPPLMSDERFRVRLEGTRPIRLTVAEMTPEDVRLAVAFAERELQLMQETAAPAMALLQRAADGAFTETDKIVSGRRLFRIAQPRAVSASRICPLPPLSWRAANQMCLGSRVREPTV